MPRTSLRIRLATRIFGVFLICVLIPFASLVAIARWQVTTFFNDKSQRQLRALAKTFGTDIFERLRLLESSLQILTSTLAQGGSLPSKAFIDRHISNPGVRWNALALITAAGRNHRLLGNIENPPEFTAAQRLHLASGKALIWISPGSENRQPGIFMSVLVDPQRAKSDLIVGEINHGYLWGLGNSRVLPAFVDPCVTDLSGSALMCSFAANSLPGILKKNIHQGALGDFEWKDKHKDFFASYWTVPTKFDFLWPGCTVVLRTSKEGVFASIAEIEATFLLWVTVCLGASILIASYQIRTRLVPVEKLQEATRRIADQDFAFRAKVDSGDEFEELAASINAMAAQLGRQFTTLNTKAAIDRAVLSLLDTSKITETILTRIMILLGCDRGTMTFPGAGESVRAKTFRIDRPMPRPASAVKIDGIVFNSSTSPDPAPLPVIDAGILEPADDLDPIAVRAISNKSIDVSRGNDSDVETVEPSQCHRYDFKAWLSMPLLVNGDILGVMIFYAKNEREFTDEEISFVKTLTDQAAIAIYNSQLFEQTKEQAVELKKANQAKDDFLSVVSHELRTPLNVILGYIRLVKDKILGELTAEQDKALATVNRHSIELLAIVDSIMDATNIQNGAVTVKNNPVDLFAFFETLRSGCQAPADKDVALEWHYSDALPTLLTDEPKLQTIVQHLVNNAIKFTEAGSVTISAAHLINRESVEIKVTDTGVGIPADSLQRIFDLFEQSDNSKTRQYGGLGLGLYIVKQLTTLLGGQIDVSSEETVGSVFTLTLPLVPVETSSVLPHKTSDFLESAGLAQDL